MRSKIYAQTARCDLYLFGARLGRRKVTSLLAFYLALWRLTLRPLLRYISVVICENVIV